ncbi:MAG: serine/threonine-protein kinase [Planctomycetota bacterium]|nr:serine/threonine-protein kinase [Planctomycetota bacterium]
MANSSPIDPSDPLIGKVVDGCVLDRKLDHGSTTSHTYIATHTDLQKSFTIKILDPVQAQSGDALQRFHREAQSVARLDHPNIASIQNVGQEHGYYFIRGEFPDGENLETIIKERGKLPWKKATYILIQAANGLAHAHSKSIIHRDFKPESILVSDDLKVIKLMNFFLAKQISQATRVSVTGQIVGDPHFMSPEQAGGKETDERSDIYSLGVTYYYLVSAVKPYNGRNPQEIFLKHFFYTPESPKIYTPDLPQEVCDVIRKCLKKKKLERYQSVDEVTNHLLQILATHSD